VGGGHILASRGLTGRGGTNLFENYEEGRAPSYCPLFVGLCDARVIYLLLSHKTDF